MSILLNDEEIMQEQYRLSACSKDGTTFEEYKRYRSGIDITTKYVLKAQAKKIYEWGNEPCPHTVFNQKPYLKRQCKNCWSELQKEIEGK